MAEMTELLQFGASGILLAFGIFGFSYIKERDKQLKESNEFMVNKLFEKDQIMKDAMAEFMVALKQRDDELKKWSDHLTDGFYRQQEKISKMMEENTNALGINNEVIRSARDEIKNFVNR